MDSWFPERFWVTFRNNNCKKKRQFHDMKWWTRNNWQSAFIYPFLGHRELIFFYSMDFSIFKLFLFLFFNTFSFFLLKSCFSFFFTWLILPLFQSLNSSLIFYITFTHLPFINLIDIFSINAGILRVLSLSLPCSKVFNFVASFVDFSTD